MATSTEETVRQEIVDAIRGIATSDLGFSEPEGNVKDYLFEFEADEFQAAYLMAKVDGQNVVRCWAVDVRGNDDWFAAGNITKRTYSIRIRAYYDFGVEGEGFKAMIEGARKVRNAIRLLGSRLGNRVDIVRSTGEIVPDVLTGVESIPGKVLTGDMDYVAEKNNPDF